MDNNIKLINPLSLQGKDIPQRRWIVDQWIPEDCVTSLYGDGGSGKSLLAMQLMTAACLGKPWLGEPVDPVRSIGVFCEDTIDELHRRQEKINLSYGCSFSDLDNMRWYSGVGENNILMDFENSSEDQLTNLYFAIMEKSKEFGAQLIIIDTAADTFGGNENARAQVRLFINKLTRLALEINGAVVLCAHPSVSGMASGRGDGGNTAWNNSVRSRLYLEHPKDDEEQDNTDLRILSRKKSNYARKNDAITLTWQDHVFAPQVTGGSFGLLDQIERNQREKLAEQGFLKAMDDFEKQGRNLSVSNRSGNYAPKTMRSNSNCKGLTKRDLENAMNRLFDKGIIKNESYGRPSNQSQRIIKTSLEDEG
jgi:RecA-family ATPase